MLQSVVGAGINLHPVVRKGCREKAKLRLTLKGLHKNLEVLGQVLQTEGT
jgi:hypothetical protein